MMHLKADVCFRASANEDQPTALCAEGLFLFSTTIEKRRPDFAAYHHIKAFLSFGNSLKIRRRLAFGVAVQQNLIVSGFLQKMGTWLSDTDLRWLCGLW
jgi:hypothetical protein